MKGNGGDEIRLNHIIDAINEIEEFISGMTEEEFYLDKKTSIATVKHLEIIGEASNILSDEIKEKMNNINWRSIIDFRNVLVHQYFGIDYNIVWDIIINDLPILKNAINDFLYTKK